MPSRETSEHLNIEPASSDPEPQKKTGKKLFRSISRDHGNQAMTYYLRSLSMIDKDEEVTHINTMGPQGLEVKVERTFHD